MIILFIIVVFPVPGPPVIIVTLLSFIAIIGAIYLLDTSSVINELEEDVIYVNDVILDDITLSHFGKKNYTSYLYINFILLLSFKY